MREIPIEEKVFKRRRFNPERMRAYGFTPFDGCEPDSGIVSVAEDRTPHSGRTHNAPPLSSAVQKIEVPFMNGDFAAEIRVDDCGNVRGKVKDLASGEEYVQLRNPNYTGSYVGMVRDAYEKLLLGIAAECCESVDFESDQANLLAARILDKYGVAADFPWSDGKSDEYGVFRHHGSKKWFALIMNIDRRKLEPDAAGGMIDVVNLKVKEEDAADLQAEEGIFPAWHMNHKTWISVILDGRLADTRVNELVDTSFKLTMKKPGKISEELVRQVLDVANSIPPGKVASYGQIARMIGRENNSRMIGRIMSMADRYGEYPCHRVVNHAGRTVPGWPEQRELLEAEGVTFKSNGNVDMNAHRWKK